MWLVTALVVLTSVALYWLATRTRLAHIPALWKCVLLSLVAHVLLVAYAYSTIWITPSLGLGGKAVESWATVRVVDENDNVPVDEELVGKLQPNINRFDTVPELPAAAPLPQPLDDWELEIEHVFGQTDQPNSTPPDPAPNNLEPSMTAELPRPAPSFVESLPLITPPDVAAAFSPVLPSEPNLERQAESGSIDNPPAKLPDEFPSERATATEIEMRPPAPSEASAAPGQPPVNSSAEQSEPLSQIVIDKFLNSSQPVPVNPLADPSLATPINSPRSGIESPLTPADLPPVQARSAELALISPSLDTPQTSPGDVGPVRLADARPVPPVYSLRDPQLRMQRALDRGGSPDTEQAVSLGLEWLAKHQDADGRWNPRTSGGGVDHQVQGHQRPGSGVHCDTAITGLALLAFLAGGHTHLSGDYQQTVGNGLQFLMQSQAADGNLSGQAALYDRMYCHGIALLAISETLAATGDQRLMETVQRAVDYSVRSQHSSLGGWRYQPGDEGDMSQFGWQVMGLHSAALGGALVPDSTTTGMQRFLHSCTRGHHRGLGCYRPGEAHNPTMTAEALMSRWLLYTDVEPSTRQEAIDYIVQHLPHAQYTNYYYWYYGTMAMHHAGGPEWERWNQALQQTLLAKQLKTGQERGSWPADGVWSGYGGKVYSTAMATLCLEVYYRYQPQHEVSRLPGSPRRR